MPAGCGDEKLGKLVTTGQEQGEEIAQDETPE